MTRDATLVLRRDRQTAEPSGRAPHRRAACRCGSARARRVLSSTRSTRCDIEAESCEGSDRAYVAAARRGPAPPTHQMAVPTWPCRAAFDGLVLLPAAEEAERAGEQTVATPGQAEILRATSFHPELQDEDWPGRNRSRAAEIPCLAGGAPEPFVDADDIAGVGVAALTDLGRHRRATTSSAGPRPHDFRRGGSGVFPAVAATKIRYSPYLGSRLSPQQGCRAGVAQGRRDARLHLRRGPDGQRSSPASPTACSQALGRAPRTSATLRARRRRHRHLEPERASPSGHRASRCMIAMVLAGSFLACDRCHPALSAADDRTLVDAIQPDDRQDREPRLLPDLLGVPALAAGALVGGRSGSATITGQLDHRRSRPLHGDVVFIAFAVHLPLDESLRQAATPPHGRPRPAVRDDSSTPWVAGHRQDAGSDGGLACLVRALVLRVYVPRRELVRGFE